MGQFGEKFFNALFGSTKQEAKCAICKGKLDPSENCWTAKGYICAMCCSRLKAQGVDINALGDYLLSDLHDMVFEEYPFRKADEGMSNAQKREVVKIKKPPIILRKNEECYYMGKATAYRDKTVVVGYEGRHAGTSFRIMKGVSIRTGASAGKPIRQNVGERSDGYLYITNQRIMMLSSKLGFEIPLIKLTSIGDAAEGFIFFHGEKSNIVLTDDKRKITNVLGIIEIPETPSTKKVISNKTEQKAISENSGIKKDTDVIREYKKLLDEGIITEAEFEAKKKQILGIVEEKKVDKKEGSEPATVNVTGKETNEKEEKLSIEEKTVADDDVVITKEEITNGENVADQIAFNASQILDPVEYGTANIVAVQMSSEEFASVSNKETISKIIKDIVLAEAPILKESLMKVVFAAFGVTRQSSTVEAFEKAFKFAKIKGTKQKGQIYCWDDKQDPCMYSMIRINNERSADEICLQEIRNAACYTLLKHGKMDSDELLKAMAKTFGYKRLGKNIESAFGDGLSWAKKEGYIDRIGSQWYDLPKDF